MEVELWEVDQLPPFNFHHDSQHTTTEAASNPQHGP